MGAPFWAHPDYVAAQRHAADARLALFRAATVCPHRADFPTFAEYTAKFDAYQAEIMQPLRDGLRKAADAVRAVKWRLIDEEDTSP